MESKRELQNNERTVSLHFDDVPLPRPERRKKRSGAERGLPPDQEIRQLAAEYLATQRRLWPALVELRIVLEESSSGIDAMVADYKGRHCTGRVDPQSVQLFLSGGRQKLGGFYGRYSCDNSNPKSISDQMVNGLEKARQEMIFVPWQYIFADYSVSGLNVSREGYSRYKSLLHDQDQHISTTYIDDFTRASRDEIEWWRLAHLSRRLGKRMVGASDGFDLSASDWELRISIYALLSRLFIKGLQQKVRRGMRGAARRGTVLGRPPLGFTRIARRGDDGNVTHDRLGGAEHVWCIDPSTADLRRQAYELFVEKCWSPTRIARHFNALNAENWNGWTPGGISRILRSSSSVGVFIWNKARNEFDHESNRWVTISNPRKDWIVHYDPKLALISIDLFRKARKRLSASRIRCPLTGRKLSRNEKSATTLFSGTLKCGYCGKELTLVRSHPKYKVMGCTNSLTGGFGCRLTSKSTRIVESCLSTFLFDQLLTEEVLKNLVGKANDFLIEEAKRPRIDTKPLITAIRKKETEIAGLFKRIENSTSKELLQAYDLRIAGHQKQLNELRVRLRSEESKNATPPPALDLESLKVHLADFRAVLNQEIPAAAAAIRELTGPITIRQQPHATKKRGAVWIAEFSPDLVKWLRDRAQSRLCPDSITLEYLSARNWTMSRNEQAKIDAIPEYERIASEMRELKSRGCSDITIAASKGISAETVRQAIRFGKSGERPKPRQPRATSIKSRTRHNYADIAPRILRLRDVELMSFRQIATTVGIPASAVRKAYDAGHPEAIGEAVEHGRTPMRGRYAFLPSQVREQMRRRLIADERPSEVARDLGIGQSTIYRLRRTLRDGGELPFRKS